jgi:uncharacterized protein (TIGR03083 family)
LATAQHDAFLALLRSLDAADWARPTDCAGWTVRDVVAHVVGLSEEAVRPHVMIRHIILARRRYPALNLLDGTNAVQIDDRCNLTVDQLMADFARLAPRAVRARRRTPKLVRRVKPPAGFALPPDMRLRDVIDVVVVRDAWMHRIDIARACGRELPFIEADAEVVAQVIRDLDRCWRGHPLILDLVGPTGGRWRIGDGNPVATVRLDGVAFCRSLSGRSGELGCEVHGDPEVERALRAARVVF